MSLTPEDIKELRRLLTEADRLAVDADANGYTEGALRPAVRAQRAAEIALRNAAPALIAEVRALRAALTEAKRLGLEACDRATHTEQCGKTQADYHHSKGYRGCPGEDEDCTCGLAAIAAALEAL